MFWGCFTYDFKGPCHIWKPQTKKELDESKSIIKIWNQALEPKAHEAWKKQQDAKRTAYKLRYNRCMSGAPAKWKFTTSYGAFTRSDGGGIDWWRYLTNILIPKLLPFTQSLTCLNPDTIVQEDKATSHIAKIHQTYFDACEIQRLLWPGNSPDLNMIEPCWGYLKRVTTKRGAPTSRAAAEKAWLGAWQDLEQWRIQQWIERIPRHIQKIIEFKGGNDYREGAEERQRSRKQLREAANRKLPTIVEVLQTGYETLRNHCGLPDAYLQFFLPTQSHEEIEEITEEEWQKSVDIIVPNPRQNSQGPGLIADRRLYNQRR